MSARRPQSVTSPAAVAALRHRVRTGRYKVDVEKVAAALYEELLKGSEDRKRWNRAL